MNKKLIKNIISLYGFSIAKIILPLITLPYLTRVLSVETYGMIAYVKSIIGYFQLFIDFGFMFSGTKKIVRLNNNKSDISKVIGNVMLARIFIAVISLPILYIICEIIPVLRYEKTYVFLAFIPVILSVFLFDFVFRGLEKMHVLTIRFFAMKGLSTVFTLFLVKSNSDILWIPALDIIGSLIALVFVFVELKKEKLHIKIEGFKAVFLELQDSAVFFVSNMSQTIFVALNTLVIGVFLSASDVAYWSLCIQMITAIQTMYQPITDGIYPHMVQTKNFSIVKKILCIFMPIIFAGCVFTFFVAKYALIIIGGGKYAVAANVLRCMTPVMFFGFPCIALGWPSLGAINKDKEVTVSTIISAIFQLIGLYVLGLTGRFNLMSIAIWRSLTEILLFSIRTFLCIKNRKEFVGSIFNLSPIGDRHQEQIVNERG